MNWAGLAAAGNAMKAYDDQKRANAIQDEQLAGQRADRDTMRRMNELKFAELADTAATTKRARDRADQYSSLATNATGDEDFLTKKIEKAKELGDGDTMLATKQQLASLRAANLSKTVASELGKFQMTGDPTALQNIYNTQVPDGKKVLVTPINPPSGASAATTGAFGAGAQPAGAAGLLPATGGNAQEPMYKIQTMNASGKVEHEGTISKGDVGLLAHQMMNPKFAEQVFMEDLKDKREVRKQDAIAKNKLNYDNMHQGFMFERQKELAGVNNGFTMAQMAVQNANAIRLGQSNAGAHAAGQIAVEKFKMANKPNDAGAGGLDVKEQDKRVQMGINALQKAMGEDEFGRLRQTNQPLYLKAIAQIGAQVRAGTDPERAASEVTTSLIREQSGKGLAKDLVPGTMTPQAQDYLRKFSSIPGMN